MPATSLEKAGSKRLNSLENLSVYYDQTKRLAIAEDEVGGTKQVVPA